MKPILVTTAAVLFLSIAAHGQEIDKAKQTNVKGTTAPAAYKSSAPEKKAAPAFQAAEPEEQKAVVPEPSIPKVPEPVEFQKQPAAPREAKNMDRPKTSTLQPMKKVEVAKEVRAMESHPQKLE